MHSWAGVFIVAGAFVLPAFRGKIDSITLIGSKISVLPISPASCFQSVDFHRILKIESAGRV
jgi:hypothetical protein